MRRHSLLPSLALIAACTDTGSPRTAMLTVTSRNPFYGIAGAQAPESVVVRVVDADGEGVPDRAVSFTVLSGGGHLSLVNGRSDSRGYVSTAWTLGASPDPQVGRVWLTDGPSDTPAAADALPLTRELIAVPVQASAEASAMLGTLGWYLPWARATLAGNLPRNPGIAQHIEAKMALLATPGLGSDIVSEKRVVEGEVLTATRAIPLAAMFPVEAMRADAQQSITVMQETVPILEQFLVPFPTARVRLWHGFIIGNSGGGGGLNMEDRASWAARGVTLPYDAVIAHELAHSYVGNEALTQFLELYAHNVRVTGSTDIANWTAKRGYTGPQASNTGLRALLDIYVLVGPAVMSQAYKAILPLNPGYGVELSAAVQQAFVNAVPADQRSAVAAKLAMVGLNP